MNARKIIKRLVPHRFFRAVAPLGHLVEAIVYNALNGFPARKLKVIGVTGTNGKTTTSFMIHRMLHEAGYKVGLMTTVAYGVGDAIHPQVHHMTNVGVPEFLRRLKAMKRDGMEWLVLETTSHALVQHRVWGVPYSVAVLTNVTHEHLDYHGTFERYRDAKRKLFKRTNRNRRGLRTGVINAEDPSAELFAGDIAHPVLYGVGQGQVLATNIQLTSDGSTFDAMVDGDRLAITCHLPGSFNVYNALATVGVGRALGLDNDTIVKGIASLQSVEGRMTRIDAGQDFSVIVDFAHTPDSFEKLFRDLKPVVSGKLIVLFGSAGRRDEAKRAIQGRLAGEYADEIVLTEEDDRDVDGTQIMEQIAEGAQAAGKQRDKNLFLVHDRATAIEFALRRAKKGDTVLLLGKGHEKTIERADGEHSWDEIATTQTTLKTLLKR